MFNLAPPTEEELKKFKEYKESAPAPVEPPKPEAVETPSDIGDFLKGAGQGVTLGFGDEILAALQATLKPSELSWYESYRKKQQENEQAYKEAQERSPWLTLGGEVASGFLIPGGAAIKGAKALGATTPAMKAAVSGGIVGGIAGLGASEKTIETPMELVGEGVKGAAFGGALGGATAKSGQLLSEYVQESPKIQRALKALGLEASGVNLTTSKGQTQIIEEFNDTAQKTADDYLKYFELASEDLNDTIRKVGIFSPGELYNFKNPETKEFFKTLGNNPLLKSFPDLADFTNFDKQGLVQKVDEVTGKIYKDKISISDLLNLRDKVKGNVSKLAMEEGISDNNKKIINNFIDKIDKMVNDTSPEIFQAYNTKRQMAYPVEAFLSGKSDAGQHWKSISGYGGKLKDPRLKDELVSSIKRKIRASAGVGSDVVESQIFLKELEEETQKRLNNAMQQGGNLESKILDGLAGNVDGVKSPSEIQKKLKDTSEKFSALRATEGIDRTQDEIKGTAQAAAAASAGISGVPIGLASEGLTQIFGKLGRLEYGLGKPVTKTRDLIKTYGVDKLKGIAEQLKSSKTAVGRNLGEAAAASLDNSDSASRAAFINSIMQNPDLRKELGLTVDKD
jgi:hypothetical protein